MTWPMHFVKPTRLRWLRQPQTKGHSILLLLLMLSVNSLTALAQLLEPAHADPTDPAEIVWMMVARNGTRQQALKYFTALRHYHVDVHGLGRSMSADMHVQVTYIVGAGKRFQIIDEAGSRVLLNHVLRKLLQAEQIDSIEQKAALTPFNYNFLFERETSESGRRLYLFSVEPRTRNRLLYRGKIWIDATDYAVVRVEAQPMQRASFWIKDTAIQHIYGKVGEFWLPQSNISQAKVRSGGTALLSIDYGSYLFEVPHQSAASGAGESDLCEPPLGIQ